MWSSDCHANGEQIGARKPQRKKPLLVRAVEFQHDGTGKEKTIRGDELQAVKEPFHENLTEEQAKLASALWPRIGVYVRTKPNEQEWIGNFRYELHPENELAAWKRIAGTFEAVGGPELSKEHQGIVIRAILFISMGVVDVESQTGLSEKVVWATAAGLPRARLIQCFLRRDHHTPDRIVNDSA